MAGILLEQFSSIVDFFLGSLEVQFAVCEMLLQLLILPCDSIFIVDGVVELMSGGGEILLKLCVFPGCFFVLVEVVFELGDLIFKLNVLVAEAVGLI